MRKFTDTGAFVDPVTGRVLRGAYHRRHVMLASAGLVRAGMEDEAHRFELELRHDNRVVTGIKGVPVLAPWTTCPGALPRLDEFLGTPIEVLGRARIEQRLHCTHLADVARLAISQAARWRDLGEALRQYDLRVLDRLHDQTRAEARRDGALVLSWELDGNRVILPARWAGLNPMGRIDFGAARPDDDDLEAVMVLRRTVMVSRARTPAMIAFRRGHPDDMTPRDETNMIGACHSYNGAALDQGRPVDTWRDHADSPNALLAGFPGMRALAPEFP